MLASGFLLPEFQKPKRAVSELAKGDQLQANGASSSLPSNPRVPDSMQAQ